MKIGVLKEIKDNENRVALTPAGAYVLAESGNDIFVERNAGFGSGFSDSEYKKAGAKIVDKGKAWKCELVMKVKEPLKQEYDLMHENSTVFTYFHLAGVEKELTQVLLKKDITAIAYETVTDKSGSLPLLMPMSQVAGRMSVLVAAHYLTKITNGFGVLLPGIPGVKPGKVIILGAGNVGYNAAIVAAGMGADVTVIDIDAAKLQYVESTLKGRVTTLVSNKYILKESVKDADALIGGVLIPGAQAPKLISEEMVISMKKGSVIVDVAIDQGGCIATSRPTKHSNPVYEKHGVIHYCVTNMPGAYPRTSTLGLTGATLPYALKLSKGIIEAIKHDKGLANGVNTFQGKVTCQPVAEKHDFEFYKLEDVV